MNRVYNIYIFTSTIIFDKKNIYIIINMENIYKSKNNVNKNIKMLDV